MRITEVHATNIPPVASFNASGLSDVVIIAGVNGVGKTRLVTSLLTYFNNFRGNAHFIINATSPEERKSWGKTTLDTSNLQDVNLLQSTLKQNKRRRYYRSGILYYESNRAIQNVQPLQFAFDFPDPWEEVVAWNIFLQGLTNRFQDTLHAIFKKIQSQRTSIANRAIQLKASGKTSMELSFSDPLDPFRDAFTKLLGPKKLLNVNLQNQTITYEDNGQELNINQLSSGEREVLNITFDFILRQPSDCVVFFDEPELHLHPELSYRLITTLKSIGKSNQFFFCTHSPDIISSSLNESVIFLTRNVNDGTNQAMQICKDDDNTDALNRLGHSVGIVSLGRKIVLIEGTETSLDKQTYGQILKNRFPNLVLLPSEGKDSLLSFQDLLNKVLSKTLWGIDFFMLADRDAVPVGHNPVDYEQQSAGKLRVLGRYHLENYFMDEEIIASIFRPMEPADSWLCDPAKIRNCMRELAKERLSYATALIASRQQREHVGNLDIMPKGVHSMSIEQLRAALLTKLTEEKTRINNALNSDDLERIISETHDLLKRSIDTDNDTWKQHVPGRTIVKMFCHRAQLNEGRFKTMYIRQAESLDNKPFQEIIDIFKAFSDT